MLVAELDVPDDRDRPAARVVDVDEMTLYRITMPEQVPPEPSENLMSLPSGKCRGFQKTLFWITAPRIGSTGFAKIAKIEHDRNSESGS